MKPRVKLPKRISIDDDGVRLDLDLRGNFQARLLMAFLWMGMLVVPMFGHVNWPAFLLTEAFFFLPIQAGILLSALALKQAGCKSILFKPDSVTFESTSRDSCEIRLDSIVKVSQRFGSMGLTRYVFEDIDGYATEASCYIESPSRRREILSMLYPLLTPSAEVFRDEQPGRSGTRLQKGLLAIIGVPIGVVATWLLMDAGKNLEHPTARSSWAMAHAPLLSVAALIGCGLGFYGLIFLLTWKHHQPAGVMVRESPSEAEVSLRQELVPCLCGLLNADRRRFEYAGKAKSFKFEKNILLNWVAAGSMIAISAATSISVYATAPRSHTVLGVMAIAFFMILPIGLFGSAAASYAKQMRQFQMGISDAIVLEGDSVWLERDGILEPVEEIGWPLPSSNSMDRTGLRGSRTRMRCQGQDRWYDVACMVEPPRSP